MPRLSQKWLFLALALYALPRPTEDRGSTIQARSGHPRTPRDGYGPMGSGGGAYSACGVHGFEYAAAGGSEGGNRVSATEKELYTDGARHTLRSSSGKTEDARTLGDGFFPPLATSRGSAEHAEESCALERAEHAALEAWQLA